MKSLFEQMGGTYTQQGDYYLPDLKLPPEEEHPIGVWGQRRLRYLREHRPILYTNLKTTGQLRSHLADFEEQANTLFLRLVKDYAASEGVTVQLKAEDPIHERSSPAAAMAFTLFQVFHTSSCFSVSPS